MPNLWRELPPTAGLPLSWQDVVGRRPASSFEEQLSAFIGAPVWNIESSATAALIIALCCLRRRSARRKVLVPAYTCPLVVIAIAQAGLQPVICDTARDGFDFDLADLAENMNEDILAVVPTHIGGIPADMEPVLKLARYCGAFVIEDAAQSLGAETSGRQVGTLGDVGMFSLSAGKGLTIYQGGFLTSPDPVLAAELQETSQQLARHNWWREFLATVQVLGYTAFYNPAGLHLAYGLMRRHHLSRRDYEKAAGDVFDLNQPLWQVGSFRKDIGARALPRLSNFIESNRSRARRRLSWLSDVSGIKVIAEAKNARGSFPFLTVVFDEADACARALSQLWPSNLGVCQLFTHTISDYAYLRRIVGSARPTPNAGDLAKRSLTITNSPWLSDAEFHAIRVAIANAANDVRRLRLCRKQPTHALSPKATPSISQS